ADVARLASCSAGLLVHPVDEPWRFGIAFTHSDGSLARLEEKSVSLRGRHLANAGAYLFPRTVFETDLRVSERGEFEISDYVTARASRQRVELIEASFWLPIGTIEVWEAAQQNADIDLKMRSEQRG